MRFVSPTGALIIGTLEHIIGRAEALEYDSDGTPRYDGSTEVFWDDQSTVIRDGSIVYLDSIGDEWLFPQLVPEPEDELGDENEGEGG